MNITLAIDEETLAKARIAAARRGLSVSALLRSEIDRLARSETGYARARRSAVRRLRKGTRMGGGKLPKRADLHDRAGLR